MRGLGGKWIFVMAVGSTLACGAGDSGDLVAGNRFDAVVRGAELAFDSVTATTTTQGDTLRLRIAGAADQSPYAADDETTLEVTVELDAGAVAAAAPGATFVVAGTSSFPAPGEGPSSYSDGLPEEQIAHTPSAAGSPAIARIWVRNWCYCTRYGALSQTLSGSLTLEAADGPHLKGTLELDLTGAIPFFGTGLDGPSDAKLDIEFDARPAAD